MTKRILKLLHELGSVGLTGALAANMILLATAAEASPAELATVRLAVAAVSKWLLVPSLALVLVSGLLAMGFHPPFHDAGWVWVKLLLGLVLFEAVLVYVDGTAQQAAALAVRVADGADPEPLEQLMRREWQTLWLVFVLSLVSIVLSVWRPRLRRRVS